MKRHGRALGFFLLATVVMTWPLAADLGRSVPDLGDDDPIMTAWFLAWGAHRILTLDFAGFFHGNHFYPAPYSFTFSDHLLGYQPLVVPVYGLTGNIVLAYNLSFLVTFVFVGYFTYLLVRHLTGSEAAGLFGGFALAFVPWRFLHWQHISLAGFQWMPLSLLALHRLLPLGEKGVGDLFLGAARADFGVKKGPRPLFRALGWGLLAGVAAAMQLLTGMYQGVYLVMLMGLFAVYFLPATGSWRRPAVWGALGLAVAVVAATNAPILAVYRHAHAALGLQRTPQEIAGFSTPLTSYVHVPPVNKLLPALGVLPERGERTAWLGLVVVGHALCGLFGALVRSPAGGRGRGLGALRLAFYAAAAAGVAVLIRAQRPTGSSRAAQVALAACLGLSALLFLIRVFAAPDRARRFRAWWREVRGGPLFYALAAGLFGILSLGPVVYWRQERPIFQPGPYALLFKYVPGFSGMRVPARMTLVVSVCVTVLAGYGLAGVLRRLSHWQRWAYGTAAFALLAAEFFSAPLPVSRVPWDRDTADLVAWLAEEKGMVQGRKKGSGTLPSRSPTPFSGLAEPCPISPLVIAHFPRPRPDERVTRPGYHMYLSTFHWQRIVDGDSGYRPGYCRFIRTALDEFPGPRAVDVLEALGVTHAVVDTSVGPERLTRERVTDGRLTEAARIGRFDVYAVAPGPGDWRKALREPAALILPPLVPAGAPIQSAFDLTRSATLPLLRTPFTSIRVVWTGPGGEQRHERLIPVEAHWHLVPGHPGFFPRAPWYVALRLTAPPWTGPTTFAIEDEAGQAVLERPVTVVAPAGYWADRDGVSFRAEVSFAAPPPRRADPGQLLRFDVRARNAGAKTWACRTRDDAGRPAVAVGLVCRLVAPDGRALAQASSSLPCDVPPGGTVVVPIDLFLPDARGEFAVSVDAGLVSGSAFSTGESAPTVFPLSVDLP